MDIELYVIGAAMHDRQSCYHIMQKLTEGCFTHPISQAAFRAISTLYWAKVPVSKRSLLLELANHPDGDSTPFISWIEKAFTVAAGIDIEYYIHQLHEQMRKETFIGMVGQVLKKAHEDSNTSKVIENFQLELSKMMADQVFKEKTLGQLIQAFENDTPYSEWVESRCNRAREGDLELNGFKTGYSGLDDTLICLENGSYTIIGARTSAGKTTFLINLIMNIIEQYPNDEIMFFTLEMTIQTLMHKLIAAYINVDPGLIRSGRLTDEQLSRLKYMCDKLSTAKVRFNNNTPLTTQGLRNQMRRVISNHNSKIVFVDYLTRMKGVNRNTSKHLEVDEISKTLQDIALEFNIPVIALAQLNRGLTTRPDKKPLLSDLRESGSLEEDADNVLLLHRPKVYNDALKDDITEVYIAKNRIEGKLKKVCFSFDKGRLIQLPEVQAMSYAAMNEPYSTVTYDRIR